MNAFTRKNHRALFYAAWLLIGLLQAGLTPLQDDEAYYWTFSRFLDWGYFDHPPMTALLIKIGYAFFPNELGVRLMVVLLNTATVALCEALTERKAPFLFYALCGVLAVLQLSGFMAVPDLPLLFFTALFFYVYRHFVKDASPRNIVFLALVTAALMYSKYHAVLIIFFTLISNPKLFTRWQTYAAGGIALVLFLPHLWWQYGHDWISFRYHLFESNVNPYKFNYTTDYILGQLLITGPLAGFILLPALFIYKPKSSTEKALKYTGIGVLLFFLLSTFKGKVEANWTAPMVVPLLVLCHQHLQQRPKACRWIGKLVLPTLILVVLIRFVMVVDVVPARAVQERFHYYHGWPKELSQRTGNLPLAIPSSYQKASQFWFYTGKPTYSVNEYIWRRNNHNFWPLEDSLLGKPVVVIDGATPWTDSLQTPQGTIHWGVDPAFHAFSKIMIQPEKRGYEIEAAKPLAIRAAVDVPPHYSAYLAQHPNVDAAVKVGVFKEGKLLYDVPLAITVQGLAKNRNLLFRLPLSLPAGKYFLRFAIGSDAGWFTHNSDKINVEIR
jgi:hypothetical protein